MNVNSVNNNGSSANRSGNSAADLSQNFMELLVAQMQNQDPTNPMDNNQLTAQLAQFNTAAGVEKLNNSMNGMAALVSSIGNLSAASWVGRSVLIEGEPTVGYGDMPEGSELPDEFSFALADDATTVTVTLKDEAGNAYIAELSDVKKGVNTFSMDDLKNFKPAEPDEGTSYTLSFEAKDINGETLTTTALIQTQVTGVSMTENGALLHIVGHDPIYISDVVVLQK